ncbi:MAG: hypothetical protein IKW39_03565, partial [Alphaproteobacteria bacterium]|nr:hypothetical protein [Alphaproteobacteria bacterium]
LRLAIKYMCYEIELWQALKDLCHPENSLLSFLFLLKTFSLIQEDEKFLVFLEKLNNVIEIWVKHKDFRFCKA